MYLGICYNISLLEKNLIAVLIAGIQYYKISIPIRYQYSKFSPVSLSLLFWIKISSTAVRFCYWFRDRYITHIHTYVHTNIHLPNLHVPTGAGPTATDSWLPNSPDPSTNSYRTHFVAHLLNNRKTFNTRAIYTA